MAFALEEIPVSLDDFLNNQESNGFTILPDPDEDLFEAPRPETFLNRVLSNEDINEKRAPRTQPQAGIVISSAEAQPLACKPQQEIKSSIPEKSKLHLLKQRTQPIRSNTLQPTSITPPNYQTSTLTSTSKTNQRLPSAGISSTSSTTAAHIRLAPDNSTVIPKILKHVHFASIPLHPHVQPQQTAPAVLASTSNMLATPSLNSTKILIAKAEKIKNEKFDETVHVNDQVKQNIHKQSTAHASKVLNFHRNVNAFSNLVPLEPPVQDVSQQKKSVKKQLDSDWMRSLTVKPFLHTFYHQIEREMETVVTHSAYHVPSFRTQPSSHFSNTRTSQHITSSIQPSLTQHDLHTL